MNNIQLHYSYTLTYSGTGYLFNVKNEGNPTNDGDNITTLTLGGTVGTPPVNSVVSIVSTVEDSGIATLGPNTKLVINGGYYESAGPNLYKSTRGSLEITKGEFKSSSAEPLLLDGSNSDIVVKGGSFYNWDPSGGDAESKDIDNKNENNYLFSDLDLDKEKYIVLYNEPSQGWNKVAKEYMVNNNTSTPKEDFSDAINDPDVSIIEVNKNVTYGDPFELNNRGEVTINMNDNKFTVTRYSGQVISNSQVIINDGKFEGGGMQVVYSGSKLTLNNCSINMSTGNTSQNYGIYAAASAEVIINGCTISFRKNESQKRAYFYATNYGEIHALYIICGAPSSNETGPNYKENPIIEEGTGNVVIYGGEFGFDPTRWTAPGAEVTKINSSKWTVATPGITSTTDSETGKVTTVISFGTFDFDPTPWLDQTSTVTKTDTQWIVTAAATPED